MKKGRQQRQHFFAKFRWEHISGELKIRCIFAEGDSVEKERGEVESDRQRKKCSKQFLVRVCDECRN